MNKEEDEKEEDEKEEEEKEDEQERRKGGRGQGGRGQGGWGRGRGVAKISRKGESKEHHKQEQQHPQDTLAGRRIFAS